MIQNSKINNQSSNVNTHPNIKHNVLPQIKHNTQPQMQETRLEQATRYLLEALPAGIGISTALLLMGRSQKESLEAGIFTIGGVFTGIHLAEIKYNNQKQDSIKD